MINRLSEPVLVLNANFEPLNVCSIRRAVGLMMNAKATMVLNGRGMIKTSANAYPCPSIIRLQYMIKRPRPTVKLNKKEIFRRDHYTCQYCGQKSAELTVDHIIPKHLGGKFSWENLVTACPRLQSKKRRQAPFPVQHEAALHTESAVRVCRIHFWQISGSL